MTAEILIIFLLLVANGVFAMAEIAVVASRKVRLQQRAEAGNRRAQAALRLAQAPTQFLSTVQVGITLVGIFAGAYGGARLAEPVAGLLRQFPLIAPYSDVAGLILVVGAITYFSLVIGELVPKAIALTNPEGIASAVAAPLSVVARAATPIVHVLSASTHVVLAILRIKPQAGQDVTEDEIRALVRQATVAGEVAPVEQRIVEQVFVLGDQLVRSIMTPRHEIDWLDSSDDLKTIREHLVSRRHPRLLVCEGSADAVLGVIHAEELLEHTLGGNAVDLKKLLHPPLFVPLTMSVFQLLESFRSSHIHVAIVLDEFGATAGIVTPTDILEALVGDIPASPGGDGGPIVQRDPDSWLVDGTTPIEDLVRELSLPPTPEQESGTYHTLAGFVMTRLSRIPHTGDRFAWNAFDFEVVDMDGRRVDKVLVRRLPSEGEKAEAAE
ncbi:MAG: hemolysin family protein [Vicinamibacterales bacterium]